MINMHKLFMDINVCQLHNKDKKENKDIFFNVPVKEIQKI